VKQLGTIFNEKTGGGNKWSSFRVVLFLMVLAWIVRFLAPPIRLVGWGATMTPLGEPMAWLGVVLALSGALRTWMTRVTPEDIPAIIGTVFAPLMSRMGGSGGYTVPPLVAPVVDPPITNPDVGPSQLIVDSERGENETEEDEL